MDVFSEKTGHHKQYVQVVVDRPSTRVLRFERDMVGNHLNATLMWCNQHNEPAWVFNDQSFTCPQTHVVGHDTGDHDIVPPPWESRV